MLKRTEHSDLPVSEVKAVACEPWQVDMVWPIAERFVARSFARGNLAMPASLLGDLRSGRRILWLIVRDSSSPEILGAGITALYDLASGRMCKIEHFGAGHMDLDLWLDQLAVIEQYAKAQGCDRVMIEGRRGWMRKLDDYTQTAVILEKRL